MGVCGIGLGHASRSMVIAEKLLSRGCELSISTYGDAVEYFTRHGFRINKIPSVGYGLGPDGAFSFRGTILKNVFLPLRVMAQTLIEIRIMDEAEALAAFSDTRATTVLAAKLLGIPVALLLNQFYILVRSERWRRLAEVAEAASSIVGHVWSLSDEIMIADYPPPLTVSEENLRLPEDVARRTVYVGPVMSRRPRDYASRTMLKEELGFNPDEPLVLMQATGPRLERERIADRLMQALPALRDLQVVFTRGRPAGTVSVRTDRHWVLDWFEDEYRLLAAADVVLTRAGQSLLTKALAYGCRLIVVPIPRHSEQESNAQSLLRRNAAVIVREESLSPETVRNAVMRALESLDEGVLKKYSEQAEMLGGVDEVVGRILRMYK